MKIGEIKIEAIMLMFPSAQISYSSDDDESILNSIYLLKSNGNFCEYVNACVGSINRALSFIEARGKSKTKSVIIAPEACEIVASTKKVRVHLTRLNDDILSVEGVIMHGSESEKIEHFMESDSTLIIDKLPKNSECVLVYKSKIKRISQLTSDTHELDISEEIASAIPYYIKAELFECEDSEGAKIAREKFHELLSLLPESKAIEYKTVQSTLCMDI